MKRFILYKGTFTLILVIFVSFINFFLIGVPLSLLGDLINEIYVIMIFISLLLIINFFAVFYFSKWVLKSINAYLYVDNNLITYKINKNDISIPISQIKILKYTRQTNGGCELLIIRYDETVEKLYISKRLSKKIAKEINKDLIIDIEPMNKRFNNWIKQIRNELTEFIRNNKLKIIFTLIGLILTIVSIILYENFKSNIILNVILCMVNITFGVLQLYHLYFKEKKFKKFERMLFTILTAFFFILFVFLIILIINVIGNQSISIDYLVYAIMLLPSFIVVIAIVILFIVALGYM